MENVRKHRDIKLVTTEERRICDMQKLNFNFDKIKVKINK